MAVPSEKVLGCLPTFVLEISKKKIILQPISEENLKMLGAKGNQKQT